MELQYMSAGDHVVHKEHGIGVYGGLKRLDVEGVESEFILVEYRGNDRLYVPVVRADLISRYKGIEGNAPELDRLGGANWARTKARAKDRCTLTPYSVPKIRSPASPSPGRIYPLRLSSRSRAHV